MMESFARSRSAAVNIVSPRGCVPEALELEAVTGRPVTIGAVYATLARLEEKKFLSSWRVDPEPHRGGRSRRFFRVEEPGQEILAASRAMMERMWAGVDIAEEVTQ